MKHTCDHQCCSGKHFFNALGYVILALAMFLWLQCKHSQALLLKWIGCPTLTATNVW